MKRSRSLDIPNLDGLEGLCGVFVATGMYDEYVGEYFNRKAIAKALRKRFVRESILHGGFRSK